jgi:hypothetical protein
MKRTIGSAFAACLAFPLASSTLVAAIAQWDFNGGLGSSTGGSNLVANFAAPGVSAGVSFTDVTINSQPAQIAAFTRGTYFRVTQGFTSNGGGTFVNSYTLILDVMFPSRPTGWAALWQTGTANNDDGDWFINPSCGLGISGNYGGDVQDATWNRIALVVDTTQGTFTSYLNGAQVQQNTGLTLDGRWALRAQALVFADEDQENAAGFVNSAQLWDRALSAAEIAELGGPSAAGIPIPITPTLRLMSPNGGENYPAGSTQLVTWAAANPSGSVQLDLYRGAMLNRALGTIAMRDSNFVWVIDPRLGDTNNYRIQLSSISFTNVIDASDAPFSVFGSAAPPNGAFGQPLQANGGFESLFAGWQIVLGQPVTLTSAGGKGSAHAGARFFHGGLSPGGNAIVRQEIDLLAAGFGAKDIDEGVALDAEAWLRNWFGVGTFDDQVYYRVAYLDGADDELSSVRCMIAANNSWLQRTLSGLVPPGTRKLRIEIVGKHRRDLDNDSMADDVIVRLQPAFAPVTPTIAKLPMLQDVRTNAMTLIWETDGNLALHAVDWGRSSVAEHALTRIESLKIDNTHYVHRATLAGLETETRYVYRVRSGTNATPVYAFRTAPKRDTPFAVAWWGDNHQGTTTLRTHVSNMLAHLPDMIGVAGDMVNSGNAISEWHNYWFKPLEHLNCAQTRPVIFARGNHDGEHALAYAYSALPGNEAWFAFDYGNTRFIFLDSEVNTSGSPEQFDWLQTELSRPETQRAAFRVVCFHRPPWVNLWNGGGHTGETWVRSDWVPLFSQKNVDLVICGHAHNYNRGASNGVTYVISGGGGGTLDVERVAFWPLFAVEYSRYHFDLMEVDGNTLTWQTFDNNNQLIDLFTLRSRVPALSWMPPNPDTEIVSLILSGKPGVRYYLQSSSDLANWTTFSTNTLAISGPGVVTNSVPANGTRFFFRAQVAP